MSEQTLRDKCFYSKMRNVLLCLIYWAHQTLKLIKPNALPGESELHSVPSSVNDKMEIEGSLDWDYGPFYKQNMYFKSKTHLYLRENKANLRKALFWSEFVGYTYQKTTMCRS